MGEKGKNMGGRGSEKQMDVPYSTAVSGWIVASGIACAPSPAVRFPSPCLRPRLLTLLPGPASHPCASPQETTADEFAKIVTRDTAQVWGAAARPETTQLRGDV